MKKTPLLLSEFIKGQVEENRAFWYAAEDRLPGFEHGYTPDEKRANQKRLDGELDWFTTMVNQPSADKNRQKYFSETAGHRLKVLGMNVLDLTYEQINVFEKEGMVDLSQQFFEEAHRFDPKITNEDIFQASRNVWTACYLQILLGLEAKLTPAIFGYSMLYPVTDNFLDDPKRTRQEKLEFNRRFCARLRGESLDPENDHEKTVFRLIEMIEGQYAREKYPQVYESLLAIFFAQEQSLLMPTMPVVPNSVDVLGIALFKGGTSVLADGFLAAGELTVEQMQTIFNYGAFAQFMDDQEDVVEDLKAGSLTVFTEAARVGKLDPVLNRLFSYSRQVLKGLDGFLSERSTPLIQVSLKGINLLLIDACQRTGRFYSRIYLAYLEAFFPVSFAALNGLRKKINRRNLSLERVVESLGLQKEVSPQVLLQAATSHPN